jgi:hypothetical protein
VAKFNESVVLLITHTCRYTFLLYRVKDLLQKFMSETLGGLSSNELGGSGFSFADHAANLTNDLIQSLVIDASVDLDFAFGLDLNPMFDSTATSIVERLPNPFIQINQFDISASIGVNEWSTSIPFNGVKFAVTEAKALLNVSAALSSSPITITAPSELLNLVNQSSTGDRIVFAGSLDVVFPVFLLFGQVPVGFGATIKYLDKDLLDEVTPNVTIKADALISIAMIRKAVTMLRNNTAFLSDIEVLSENIPVIQTNVNELIAGADRTIADLFDLTDWADSLSGTPTNDPVSNSL